MSTIIPVPANYPYAPTTFFGDLPSDFSADQMKGTFPVSLDDVSVGIEAYRATRGYEPLPDGLPVETMRRMLTGVEFDAGEGQYRIEGATYTEIAPPIYSLGDVEMNARLAVGPIAAAVAAYPSMGQGGPEKAHAKQIKEQGDTAATHAMRAVFNRMWMKGIISGGEGGGRDLMGRGAALYRGEPVGIGGGFPVRFLVDPLEVTNATKMLNATGATRGVGEGWDPQLADSRCWYPGYSGALSLMLAVNGNNSDGVRSLSDDLYLNRLMTRWQMDGSGIQIDSKPTSVVARASAAFNIDPSGLRAASLARPRHETTFNAWMNAGMKPWHIMTPSDGDSIFAPALAGGALHFAGLTGGVMESVIGAALGIPMGVRTTFGFVSHDKLGEMQEGANLQLEAHRFGFSEAEFKKMLSTKLFDSQHIGHTLRLMPDYDATIAFVRNAAFSERDVAGFDYETFMKELEAVRAAKGGDASVRFSDPSRVFLMKALGQQGFMDVRRVLRFSGFVYDRDWLYAASALAPNRWVGLNGITPRDHGLDVETLVAGGSHAVGVLKTRVVQVR